MIKKLFILVFLALPLSLAAQNLKFGTVNTVDVFNLMPEKATAEKQLEDLSKQYESEFMKMQEEFTTKYKDFVNSQDPCPRISNNAVCRKYRKYNNVFRISVK